MANDHLLNRARNVLYFGLRYPWVRRGHNVHIQWSTTMWSPHRSIRLGSNVGIGPNCVIQCDAEIGDNVLLAGSVALIGSDDHRFDEIGKTIWDSGRGDTKRVVIEDDVWIGHGATVLAGSRVGRGSVIGAGALIVGDVEPYSIMVGSKARLLRKRFTDEELARHEAALLSRRGGHTDSR